MSLYDGVGLDEKTENEVPLDSSKIGKFSYCYRYINIKVKCSLSLRFFKNVTL